MFSNPRTDTLLFQLCDTTDEMITKYSEIPRHSALPSACVEIAGVDNCMAVARRV